MKILGSQISNVSLFSSQLRVSFTLSDIARLENELEEETKLNSNLNPHADGAKFILEMMRKSLVANT
jgi:hypothetical protein